MSGRIVGERGLGEVHRESLELARGEGAGGGIIPFMEEEVVRLEEESGAFLAGDR